MNKEDIQPKKTSNDPLHGVKLVNILETLVENYGWEHLATKIDIQFYQDARDALLKAIVE